MTKTDIKSPHIAVIIPALNEELGLQKVLADLAKVRVHSVIVCDNGSQDATQEVARKAGAQVVVEKRRGYGSACLAGLRILPKGTDIVVFLDADYSDDPLELPKLIEPIMERGFDLSLGSRVAKAQKGALNLQQRFGNWLATRLIRIFHKVSYNDLGPFRAIRFDALEKLEMRDPGMGWTVEMQLKAARQKLKTIEVDVNYRPRIGSSKISGTLVGTVRAGSKILTLIFASLLRRT